MWGWVGMLMYAVPMRPEKRVRLVMSHPLWVLRTNSSPQQKRRVLSASESSENHKARFERLSSCLYWLASASDRQWCFLASQLRRNGSSFKKKWSFRSAFEGQFEIYLWVRCGIQMKGETDYNLQTVWEEPHGQVYKWESSPWRARNAYWLLGTWGQSSLKEVKKVTLI